MLQPFVLLEQKHIDRLEQLGKYLLVVQRYYRGANHLQSDNDKTDLLLTEYSNRGLADTHKSAVRLNRVSKILETDEWMEGSLADNKYVCIINLKNIDHYQKLQQMLNGEKYRLYWNIPKDPESLKRVIRSAYREKIYRFVTEQWNWAMKGNDNISVKEEVIFGQLFVNLKWSDRKRRVELARIEKY